MDYEKPSCLPHLIPLPLHSFSKQECEKLPCARDLTSWWVKVLACMELAFQEGDWKWARKDTGDKSFRENKTQGCDRVGWRRAAQLGRVAQNEGSQRDSWAESWWEGQPVLQKPREEHSRQRMERVHGLSSGKSWEQRRSRMLPQLSQTLLHSHTCPVPMPAVGLFMSFSPHWFSQLSMGIFNTALFPLFIPDVCHNPWHVVDIQLPLLLGQGGDLSSLEHTRRYWSQSATGLRSSGMLRRNQNKIWKGYRVEKGKKKKTLICSYLLTDVINE